MIRSNSTFFHCNRISGLGTSRRWVTTRGVWTLMSAKKWPTTANTSVSTSKVHTSANVTKVKSRHSAYEHFKCWSSYYWFFPSCLKGHVVNPDDPRRCLPDPNFIITPPSTPNSSISDDNPENKNKNKKKGKKKKKKDRKRKPKKPKGTVFQWKIDNRNRWLSNRPKNFVSL